MFLHIISSSCHADLNLKGSTFLIHPAQYLYCAGNHSTSIYIARLKLGRVTMSNSKIQRLNKQHESTWAELHKRLISMPFSYTEIFNPAVGEFVRNVSHSVSSSEGYFVPCLISTTAFLVGTGSLIRERRPVDAFKSLYGSYRTANDRKIDCLEQVFHGAAHNNKRRQ